MRKNAKNIPLFGLHSSVEIHLPISLSVDFLGFILNLFKVQSSKGCMMGWPGDPWKPRDSCRFLQQHRDFRSGWWLTYPSEKSWVSPVGMRTFPKKTWKVIKFRFQTTNQMLSTGWYWTFVSWPSVGTVGMATSSPGFGCWKLWKWMPAQVTLQNNINSRSTPNHPKE